MRSRLVGQLQAPGRKPENIVIDGEFSQSALIADVLSAHNNRVVFPKRLSLEFSESLTVPAGADIDFNGSTLIKAVSDSSSAAQINVGAGAIIRNLTLSIPTGITINRGINLSGGGSQAFDIRVTAADQQANTATQQHAAFNVNGDDTRVRGVVVENFDHAVRLEEGDDCFWSDFLIVSYATGINMDQLDRFFLTNVLCHTKSANASASPGDNAIVMGNVRYGKFANLDLQDAGEHGVRVGGSTIGALQLAFSNVQISRPGQCGFKISGTERARDISISGLSVVDCHWGNAAGTNEDGLRIEKADRVHVTGFSVDSRDSTDGSCYDGIFIHDSTEITIVSPKIKDCVNHGIHLSDAGLETDLNQIYITSPTMNTIGGNGITINADTVGTELRNISITDAYIAGTTGYAVEVEALDLGILQPINISGRVWSNTAGVYNNVNTVTRFLLDVDLISAQRYETATGTFTASVHTEETRINSSAGAVTVTLPNGNTAGVTRKIFRMSNASNASTVSVTTHSTSNPEVFTFDSTGDVLCLEWTGGTWVTIYNIGVTT